MDAATTHTTFPVGKVSDLILDLTVEFGAPNIIENSEGFIEAYFALEGSWHLFVDIFDGDYLKATFAQDELRRSVYVYRDAEIPPRHWPRVVTAIRNKAKRLNG